MAVMIGADFYLEFNDINITGPNRSFDEGVMDETAEGSAARNVLRSHVKTLTKVEPKGTFIINTADTTILAALKRGQTGNLVWGVYGNGSGNPKSGITARITKSTPKITYDKEQELEVEWVNTGDGWLYDPDTATFA